jgi:K(+)-stimulated pyrophosphate-energized sodium pump
VAAIPYAAAGTAIVALVLAAVLAVEVRRAPAGGARQVELMEIIRTGALTFLRREQAWIGVFVVAVAILLAAVLDEARPWASLAYIGGAVASGSSGTVGIRIATLANARTAHAARDGTGPALLVALRGGGVMGLTVTGTSLLGFGLVYIVLVRWLDVGGGTQALAAYGFGAGSIALFGRVAGGIFTKAADIGADMVGKVDLGIPEDDPRNAAVIADNVGDNVGDVAGMGADLFESHAGALIAPVVLGAVAFSGTLEDRAVLFPFAVAAAGLLASVLTVGLFGRSPWRPRPGKVRSLHVVVITTAVLTAVAVVPLAWGLFGSVVAQGRWWALAVAIIAGVAAGVGIGTVSQVFTSARYRPVRTIAHQSTEGAATTVLTGISAGMVSVAFTALVVVAAVVSSHWLVDWAFPGQELAGLYGVALAATGMLSTTATVVSIDAYGPIADNAGGIAVMTAMPPHVRETTDDLDAVGNTTAAVAKGFAVGSAALTALALFGAFAQATGVAIAIHPGGVAVFAGLIIGAAVPFLFAALAIDAVGRAAGEITQEVRRQFRDIPGLREGRPGATPDYTRCVAISTDAALREMVALGLLAVVVPLVVGLISVEALGGLLAGAIVTGFGLAVFMANAGAAWDNAKKTIEAGAHGGSGSDAHKAAVIGDTVGDPFKDTAGPSMNILIKVMTIVALVFVPVIV